MPEPACKGAALVSIVQAGNSMHKPAKPGGSGAMSRRFSTSQSGKRIIALWLMVHLTLIKFCPFMGYRFIAGCLARNFQLN